MVLATYPMQIPMTCCWCGAHTVKRFEYVPTPGHGTKLTQPAAHLTQIPLPTGPCVDR